MAKRETPGIKAIRASGRAARWRAKTPIDRVIDPVLNRVEAEKAEAEAKESMRPPPPERMLRGANEVMGPWPADQVMPPDRSAMVNTLEEPNMISVEAAEQRMELAHDAGVMQSALDASVSAQAKTSLEKMLCHQMAAAHHGAMTVLARGLGDGLPPVEQARLLNASARLMQVYQEALVALQRFRSGGRQTVVVQHVQVSQGGQAVVAGNVMGGTQRGRDRRNGE